MTTPERPPRLTGVVKTIRETYLTATFTSDREPPDVLEADVHLSNIPDGRRHAFVPGATFLLLEPDDADPDEGLFVRIPRRNPADDFLRP